MNAKMTQIKRWIYRAWSENAEAAETYFRQAAERREKMIAAMRQAGASALSVFGGGGHWFLYAETEQEEEVGDGAKAFESPSSDSAPGGFEDRALEADASGKDAFKPSAAGVGMFDPALLLPGADSVLSAWPGEPRRRLFVPMADIFHYQRPAGGEHWRRTRQTESYGRIARLKPEKVSSYVFYHYQYQEEKPGDGDKYGLIGLHENLLFFYAERPSTVEPAPYEGMLTTRNTPEDWGAVMQPHFIEWPDKQENEKIWLNLKRAFDIRIPEA